MVYWNDAGAVDSRESALAHRHTDTHTLQEVFLRTTSIAPASGLWGPHEYWRDWLLGTLQWVWTNERWQARRTSFIEHTRPIGPLLLVFVVCVLRVCSSASFSLSTTGACWQAKCLSCFSVFVFFWYSYQVPFKVVHVRIIWRCRPSISAWGVSVTAECFVLRLTAVWECVGEENKMCSRDYYYTDTRCAQRVWWFRIQGFARDSDAGRKTGDRFTMESETMEKLNGKLSQ